MHRWRVFLCLALVGLLLASACHRAKNDDDRAGRDNENNLSLTDSFIYAGRDDARHRAGRASAEGDDPPNVVESDDPRADWDCADSRNCNQDYLDLLDRADDYAAPVSDAELVQNFREYGLAAPYRDPVPAAELKQDILDRLNSSFLFEGLHERRLEVVTIDMETTPFGAKKTLIFRDPWVGTFKAQLLLPGGTGPFPSVLAIHGHGQSGESYLQDFPQIYQLQREGFAVLILTMRAYNADLNEDRICRAYLRKGLTMLGVHLYETLLGRKYLAHLFGEQTPCGLLGHSGGSVGNNLLIRVAEDSFDAMVTDAVGYYIGDWHALIIDEAVPLLHPYHDLVNDFSTAAIPVLRVPYGYGTSWAEILTFFANNLPDPGRCSNPRLADSPDCT